MEFFVESLEDTSLLAKLIAEKLHGGEIILLNGDLGAGKTTFTKALAKALGVEAVVTSPTFMIMKEYEGKFPLYHFDMYRIDDESELFELGFEEYFEGNGICVIEWNKISNLPKKPIVVNIKVTGEESREFGVRWE